MLTSATRYIVSIVAILLASFTAANANQLADILTRKELVCATFADVPPFGFADQQTRKIVGMDIDLCTAIAEKMGVAAKQVSVAAEARIPELLLGRVDVITANLGYSKARAQQIAFSDVYYSVHQTVFVRKDSSIETLQQLSGKKLAAIKATTSEAAIRNKLPEATAQTFQDASAVLMATLQGKVAGLVVSDLIGAQVNAKLKGTQDELRSLPDKLTTERVVIGLRKGEPEMLEAVNKALYDLERSGEFDGIWAKWMGQYGIARERMTPVSAIEQ